MSTGELKRTERVGRGALALALATLAIVTIAATAAPAGAYVIAGKRWPSHTITYYDAQPDHAAVRMAVAAWNSSGANVRFVAAPRGRAKVLILPWHPGGCYGVEGVATVGYYRPGDVVHLKACANPDEAAIVAAHELGHVLGLGHELNRCATMNPAVGEHCGLPPSYTTNCRILQLDDEQGAVALYGGHAKPVRTPQFCPEYSAPLTPSSVSIDGNAPPAQTLTATVQGTPEHRLIAVPAPSGVSAPPGFSFKQTAPQLTATIYAYHNSCPAGSPHGMPLVAQSLPASGSDRVDIDLRADISPGVWCYAVWMTDAAGRRSATAKTVTVTVTHQPPVASFSTDTQQLAGIDSVFQDTSTRGDDQITTWAWDFGDGTTSAYPDPDHTYAHPGTYTVTLTVTASDGQSSTTSQQVTVQPASTP